MKFRVGIRIYPSFQLCSGQCPVKGLYLERYLTQNFQAEVGSRQEKGTEILK